MADILVSYASDDRPRAEMLRSWFEEAGWSTWIDRDIELGEDWEARIEQELIGARLVVVLWGPSARRSKWVQREALAALEQHRLLQIHATALPLLPPFDKLQAVRMQAWSGGHSHSERSKLLTSVAERLGTTLSQALSAPREGEKLSAYRVDVMQAVQLAFYYCARQTEYARLGRPGRELAPCFQAMLELVRPDDSVQTDEDGVLHRMADDFMHELLRLSPNPNMLT